MTGSHKRFFADMQRAGRTGDIHQTEQTTSPRFAPSGINLREEEGGEAQPKRQRKEQGYENRPGFYTTETYEFHHSDEGKELHVVSRKTLSKSDEGKVVTQEEYREQYREQYTFDSTVNKFAFGESDFNDDGTPKEHARADFEAYQRELRELNRQQTTPAFEAKKDLKDFMFRRGIQKQYNDLKEQIIQTKIYKEISRKNLQRDEKEKLVSKSLGSNLNTKDNRYFSKNFGEAEKYAKLFLQTFFEDEECMQALIKDQQGRVEGFKSTGKNYDPRCISFVFAYVNKNPVCFVAISSAISDIKGNPLYFNLINALQKVCNITLQKWGCQFFIAPPTSQHFNFMLNDISKMNGWELEYRIKGCAERCYAALIAKMLLNPHVELEVVSITNLAFFPFRVDINYTYETQTSRSGIDLLVQHKFSPANYSLHFQINGKEYRTYSKFNCDLCQKNYDAVIATWVGAKEIAEKQRQQSSCSNFEANLPGQLQSPTSGTMSPLPKDISEFIARTDANFQMQPDSGISNLSKPDREIEREERRRKEEARRQEAQKKEALQRKEAEAEKVRRLEAAQRREDEARRQQQESRRREESRRKTRSPEPESQYDKERREESSRLRREEAGRYGKPHKRENSPRRTSPSRMYSRHSDLQDKDRRDKERLEKLIQDRLRPI